MKKCYLLYLFIILIALGFPIKIFPQANGFVHASGIQILDIEGRNLIFRGIGTGNWMLQEGYMMNTSGATNGTQWHFRQKLIATIGLDKTNEFYNAWWDNHFTKTDVDSMANWGFNCVRVAMHYKMFTLPIEDEPVTGQDTWLEDGFVRIDNLLKWCADNKIYLILDMHAAPGAQGSDSNISDYDSSKPSLWQSEENKRKLVALWKKLAQRYANSPYIGGYDLINEPKWDDLQANANKDLWNLLKRIIDAVREVDKNHMVFLEGNNWGNDYTGLPDISAWGGNIALSFHKYWNKNEDGAIDWIINLGKSHNVPVWLGETGENSNSWYADEIRLCEKNNVGWSMWPVKKTGINNVMSSKSNSNYDQLMTAWRNNSYIDPNTAYNGVMQFAADHNIKNCAMRYDVIDAMITRPHTNETRPFKKYTVSSSNIYAVDYDMGAIGYAYYDVDDADYHGTGEPYTNWNQGWLYRNDGVDIEACSDNPTNGYSVGWTEDGEWLCYTIESPEEKAYTMQLKYSSQTGAAKMYIEINGKRASKTVNMSSTGSWKTWGAVSFGNIIMPAGNVKLKLVFEKGGANLNFLRLSAPKPVEDINFELLSANTDVLKDEITLLFNEPVDEIYKESFIVKVDNVPVGITSLKKNASNPQQVLITLDKSILYNNTINIDYNENTCISGSKVLTTFTGFPVTNLIAPHAVVPARIEAESYADKNGFTFQSCSEGGTNAGYTVAGNYLDYIVYAPYAGNFEIDFRIAVNDNTSVKKIGIYDIGPDENTLLQTLTFSYTGGWQMWRTEKTTVKLKSGKNILRIYAITDGFNLNWFEIKEIADTGFGVVSTNAVIVYPNPATDYLFVKSNINSDFYATLFDVSGKQLCNPYYSLAENRIKMDVAEFPKGVYLVKIHTDNEIITKKIIIQK